MDTYFATIALFTIIGFVVYLIIHAVLTFFEHKKLKEINRLLDEREKKMKEKSEKEKKRRRFEGFWNMN